MNIPPIPLPSRPVAQRGFTLVELVVTLAIVGILTTLAIPSLAETLRQWRRDSATWALTSSLQVARASAIKSTRRITICPSTNGTGCTANTEWRNGWIVFVDDGATDLDHDAGERIIHVVLAPSGIASMVSSGGVQQLQFLPDGLMSTPTTDIKVTPSGATASTLANRVWVDSGGRTTVTHEAP